MEVETQRDTSIPPAQALPDPYYPLVEAAFQACDAVSIRSDEPDARILGLWRQAAHQPLTNITGMPATPLPLSGTRAAIPQLAGFAGSGKRIAFIVSEDGLQDMQPSLVDGAPFVMHVAAERDLPPPFEGSFQLVARTPREALDLSLVAHRAAEAALCAGVLVSVPGRPGREKVPDTFTTDALESLLGLPADRVQTPTHFQQSLFGAHRRRIPEALPVWMRRRALQLQADVPALVEEAASAVSSVTGRPAHLVDTVDVADAEVVLVAAGGVYTWLAAHLDVLREKSGVRIGLLHPTLMYPFPADRVVRAVTGKRGVVVVTHTASAASARLVDEIDRGLEKAVLNGQVVRAEDDAPPPYPSFPAFRREDDRPPVFSCTKPEDHVGLLELAGIIEKVASRSADTLHHELPAATDGAQAAAEEQPVRLHTRPSAPRVVRDEAAPAEAEEADEGVLRSLLQFFATGRAPAPYAPLAEDHTLVPAHLHRYLDVSRLRGDYPICLPEGESEPVAASLTSIFDRLLEGVEEEGETGDRQRHELRQLEGMIRRLVEEGREARLRTLWDEATDAVAERLASDRRPSLREHLAARKERLNTDGPVFACIPDAPVQLFHATGRAVDEARTERMREELDVLTSGLVDILAVDESNRPEARDAGRLEASIGPGGASDIDAGALADLLSRADVAAPLPEARRDRVVEALETIEELRPELFPEELGSLLCDEQEQTDAGPMAHCATAVGQLQARLRSLVTFFRAVHIGRLEVDNRYRPERHDEYFARYGWGDLTDEERAFCPPLLIHLDSAQTDRADKDLLVELLGSGLPVKILVTVDRVCDADGTMPGQACFSGWRSRLAAMGMSLQRAFVHQTAASNLRDLLDGFDEGLRFDGPALFAVYIGSAVHSPHLPPYLRSAVALEGRALPSFRFNPSMGSEWATRFDVGANPSVEAVWPVSEIAYESADTEETHTALPFTFADFLACDRRLSQHFMLVPRRDWHPNMMPLADFLRSEQRERRVPYITMMDEEGVLHRVLVTRELARSARNAADFWHSLQELGGINSSHARRAVEREIERLEQEKQEAIDALDRKHREELDRATGALAEDIISNIASGLLSLPSASPQAGPSVGVKEAPAPDREDALPPATEQGPEPSEAATYAGDDEEEELGFDEPYIETLRCTSCNECININGQIFAYNEDKQAFIKDATAGPYRDLVVAAEECPVNIIHPGKPTDPSEEGVDELMERAEPYL